MENVDRNNVASISDNGTGIKSVIIWIGCKINGRTIIKVSNKPEDLTGTNLFSIDVTNYNIIGKVNKNFISDDVIEKIRLFIERNKDVIIKYTNEQIFADELVDELVPINLI